jgi:hypothetical protein
MRNNNNNISNGTLTPTRDPSSPYHIPRGPAKADPALLLLLLPVDDDTIDTANTTQTLQHPFFLSTIRSDDNKRRNVGVSQRSPWRNCYYDNDMEMEEEEEDATTAAAHHYHCHHHCTSSSVFRSSSPLQQHPLPLSEGSESMLISQWSRENDSYYTLQRSPAFDYDDC